MGSSDPRIAPIRRVAVTGAAGYLAGRLIERLEREPAIERVLALDVRPLPGRHGSKVLFQGHDVTTSMDGLFREHSIDSVAHLAYVMSPGHRRGFARRVNVDGTANVLEASATDGVRYLLYLSSTSVYGAWPDNPGLLTEEHAARLLRGFQYSEDKVAAEALILKAAQSNPSPTATILRVCPVMGPHADNFIARAFSKPLLVGVMGFDPPMQLVHEDDLVEAAWLCLQRQAPGVFNVCGEGSVRWSEMARLLGRRMVRLPSPLLYGLVALGWALRLQRDSPACGVDFIRYPWVASIEKARRELGFEPRYTSRQAWEAFVGRQRQPRSAQEVRHL